MEGHGWSRYYEGGEGRDEEPLVTMAPSIGDLVMAKSGIAEVGWHFG